MPENEEKEEVEEDAEKKKEPSFLGAIPRPFLIGGIFAALLIMKSMSTDTANKPQYMWWLLGLFAIIFLLTKAETKKIEPVVSPREADILVERELERKKRWGQFGLMSKYHVGPVGDLHHKDGGGIYYDVAVKIDDPFDSPKHYIAKVMAKGKERGFVTFSEAIGPATGREKVAEKTIIPEWLSKSKEYPILERVYTKE